MSQQSYAFPKSLRLLKRRDFCRVSSKAVKVGGKLLYIDCLPNNKPETRLGITVTKRYGNSPERNRFKRRIRESFRTVRSSLPKGLDIVVKPRAYVKEAHIDAIKEEFVALLKHVRVANDPGTREPES